MNQTKSYLLFPYFTQCNFLKNILFAFIFLMGPIYSSAQQTTEEKSVIISEGSLSYSHVLQVFQCEKYKERNEQGYDSAVERKKSLEKTIRECTEEMESRPYVIFDDSAPEITTESLHCLFENKCANKPNYESDMRPIMSVVSLRNFF